MSCYVYDTVITVHKMNTSQNTDNWGIYAPSTEYLIAEKLSSSKTDRLTKGLVKGSGLCLWILLGLCPGPPLQARRLADFEIY